MVKTRALSLIACFAAAGAVCDAVLTPGFSAGVWYGLEFMFSPIAGIALGPYNGFASTLIAVMVGHLISPRETAYEFIFALGAPVGSMVSGFVLEGKLRRVFAYYTFMLAAYFAAPVSRMLPLWGMWDCYLAYLLLALLLLLSGARKAGGVVKRVSPFALSAFLGLEADVLLRIFIFVPLQTYRFFYGLTPEALAAIWAAPAPVITPLKVFLSTLTAAFVGPRVKRYLSNKGYL